MDENVIINGVWKNPKPVPEKDRIKWQPYPMDRGALDEGDECIEVDLLYKKHPFDVARFYVELVDDSYLEDNYHLIELIDLDNHFLGNESYCYEYGAENRVLFHNSRDLGEPGCLTFNEWEKIKESWGGRCAYCREIPKPEVVEHVFPISLGGKTTKENIVLSCWACNTIKGRKTIDRWLSHDRADAFKKEHSERLAITFSV